MNIEVISELTHNFDTSYLMDNAADEILDVLVGVPYKHSEFILKKALEKLETRAKVLPG